MSIVFVVNFVAGTLPAWGSSPCTGLYTVATGLHQLFFRFLVGPFRSLAMPSLLLLTAGYSEECCNRVLVALSVTVHAGSGISSSSMRLAPTVGRRWAVMVSALNGITLAVARYATVRKPPAEKMSWSDVVTAVSDPRSSRVPWLSVLPTMMKIMAASTLTNFLPFLYFRMGLPVYTSSYFAAWGSLFISSACAESDEYVVMEVVPWPDFFVVFSIPVHGPSHFLPSHVWMKDSSESLIGEELFFW